jgi:hypothetical protein
MGWVVRVEVLLAPDCPNAAAARAMLVHCLTRLGLAIEVRERVGGYPSPTILVDGVDVMTGTVGAPAVPACRLDVPTESRLLAALPARAATPTAGCSTIIPET